MLDIKKIRTGSKVKMQPAKSLVIFTESLIDFFNDQLLEKILTHDWSKLYPQIELLYDDFKLIIKNEEVQKH